jgi:hypothetical protein
LTYKLRENFYLSLETQMPVPSAFPSWFEWLKVIISFATFGSIVIAYLAYRANLQKIQEDRICNRDKELLAQTEKSMSWAYNVLTNETKTTPPEPNRLNWLTCARHLLRCRELAGQITSSTYKTLHAESEEYWRHKFYTALSHKNLRIRHYYADQTNPDWPENIEISSALVVVDFSNWKKGSVDPIDRVDRDALIKSGGGIKGGWAGSGLEQYIRHLNQIKREHNTIPQSPNRSV